MTELVAISSNKQERVVRTGTEHDDLRDACRSSVKPDSQVWREVCNERRRDLVGQSHDDERHEPKDWTAIGGNQEQGDHDDGGQEKVRVGAVKDVAEVGDKTRSTGDGSAHPVNWRLLQEVTHGRHAIGNRVVIWLG